MSPNGSRMWRKSMRSRRKREVVGLTWGPKCKTSYKGGESVLAQRRQPKPWQTHLKEPTLPSSSSTRRRDSRRRMP